MLYRNSARYPPGKEWQFIQDLKIGLGGNIRQSDFNLFKCWNPNEEIEHRITKWMLFDILTQRGHKVIVEGQLGGGVFDILDCSTQIIYEIEQKKSQKILEKKFKQFNSFLIKDLKFIYLEELPKDWKKRYEKLKEYV